MKRANRRARAEAPPRPATAFTPCCCSGIGPHLSALLAGAAQNPVFDHFRNAGVEVLKGFRAALDAQIEYLSREERRGGRRVPVE